MAQGEYVCHMDGDDRWLAGKLQIQADFLDANEDFTVVWTRANLFNDQGGFFPGEQADYSMFENEVIEFSYALRFGSVAVHSSIMYRSNARLTRVSEIELLDLYFTWEYLSQGKGKILNYVGTEYRLFSDGSMTNTLNFKIKNLNAAHINYYLEAFPEKKKDIFLFSFYRLLAHLRRNKNLRTPYLGLSLKSLTYVSPFVFYKHVKNARKLHHIPNLKN
jgi:hypothetical protein